LLFSHLRERLPRYPRRFGWLVVIYFFNRVAASLIWPFMMIFIREQTAMPTHPALMQIGNVGMTMPLPLVVITPLLSLQAVASVLGTALIGLLMDRFGRKRVMLVGLVG